MSNLKPIELTTNNPNLIIPRSSINKPNWSILILLYNQNRMKNVFCGRIDIPDPKIDFYTISTGLRITYNGTGSTIVNYADHKMMQAYPGFYINDDEIRIDNAVSAIARGYIVRVYMGMLTEYNGLDVPRGLPEQQL